MVLLDRGEDEVLQAIETGALAWAWNIATPEATRREIRVWRDSLLALLNGEKELDQDETVILSKWLPPRDLRSPELQRLWSCSSTHIHALLSAGALTQIGVPESTQGPRSFAVISRESVVAFLRWRRST